VLQLLKLPDGTVKVLVEGAQRAKVLKYTDRSEYYEDGVARESKGVKSCPRAGCGKSACPVPEAVALGDTMGERAQFVLRAAVGKNLDAILKCEDLLRDAQAHFGTFMSYVFHQQPQEIRTFLSEGWSGRPPR
jgi:hypothetical protein